jgi:hypothetical protein
MPEHGLQESEQKYQQRASFIIERFDHYFDSVNNKGQFYIGLNTFIIGGIVAGFLLHDEYDMTFRLFISALLTILCGGISIILTVLAIMPFLKDNHSENDNPSKVFFGGISRYQLARFKEVFRSQQDDQFTDDLLEQAHCLAGGLTTKFGQLKWASRFLIAEFICLVPLIILFILNVKNV